MAPKVVPAWRTQIDFPFMGSPVIGRVADRVVAAFGFGGRSASSGGLLVLDAVTGATVWQFDAGSGVEGGAAIGTTRASARAYFGDQLGRMHCLDLQRQAEVWHTALDGGIVAAPLLAHGKVYVGTSTGLVACLDPDGGRVIRAEKVRSQLVSAQPMHVTQEARPQSDYLRHLRENIAKSFSIDEIETLCADLGIDFEDLGGEGKRGKARELVEFMDRRGRLSDLVSWCEAQRVNVSWKMTPTPVPHAVPDVNPARQAARIAASPVAWSLGGVLVGALDGGLYHFDPDQPGTTSTLTRKFDAGVALYATPIVHPDVHSERLILANHGGDVIAWAVATGKEAWRTAIGKSIRATPRLAGDTLYFGTHGRTLHALNVTDGQEHWQMEWRNSITTTPLVAGGRVVFGDTQGRVVCVDEATKRVVREFDAQADRPGLAGAPAAVFGGFALHEDRVIFGAHNGCAYALRL